MYQATAPVSTTARRATAVVTRVMLRATGPGRLPLSPERAARLDTRRPHRRGCQPRRLHRTPGVRPGLGRVRARHERSAHRRRRTGPGRYGHGPGRGRRTRLAGADSRRRLRHPARIYAGPGPAHGHRRPSARPAGHVDHPTRPQARGRGAAKDLDGTGARAYVTGTTAVHVAFRDVVVERLPWIVAVVVGAAFLLLLCVFRSLLVAVKAALLNLLSISAAYGVLVAVFQWGWGGRLFGVTESVPVESYVPMMMFAIVFGLSMDYEVFLLARIREAWLETGDNHDSVAGGLAATARVISCAAIVMTSVFLAFLLSTQVVIKMLALGLGVSVVIDATVVRLLLVPATMYLFGRANWWLPRWLDRLLPRLDPEGTTARSGQGAGA
ncbi:MMPL family transporter [Streptomyces sp. SLBN-118]|uniref:MMPL family transporter n=1 Tax=Streptomyces sp. SLBN-118 TaxID=2768454 RepID=UPI0028C50052|nr:MMPL family transporter [Streptomyces sp. SLBN-118]